MTDFPIKGQCLCGGVQFETRIPHKIDACHCKMCQRWAGAVFIGADFRSQDDVQLTQDTDLVWYRSSDWAERGFCKSCGSSLFYRLKDNIDFLAVCAGTLDLPQGSSLSKEIFIDEKPDYFDLAGDQEKLTGEEFMASLNLETLQ